MSPLSRESGRAKAQAPWQVDRAMVPGRESVRFMPMMALSIEGEVRERVACPDVGCRLTKGYFG